MGWLQWHSLGTPGAGIAVESIAGRLNAFGQLELFAKASDKNMYNLVQHSIENNTWSSWRMLGAPRPGDDISNFDVARYADNRLELFAISPRDGDVYYTYQITPTEDWSSWNSLGSPAVGQILSGLAAVDYDRNRLDIFVINTADGTIYQKFQGTSGWSSWRNIRPPVVPSQTGIPTFARVSTDSPLEIFIPSLIDRKIYHNKESISAPGQWTGWTPLDSPAAGGTSVYSSTTLTKRKDIFTVDRSNVYNKYYSSGVWSAWELLGGPGTAVRGREISVGTNVFGHIDLFVSEGENLFHKHQFAPNFIWSNKWLSLGIPSPGRPLTAARNFNYRTGQIAVVVIDASGVIHYCRQM